LRPQQSHAKEEDTTRNNAPVKQSHQSVSTIAARPDWPARRSLSWALARSAEPSRRSHNCGQTSYTVSLGWLLEFQAMIYP
jgi:hypothetical protein